MDPEDLRAFATDMFAELVEQVESRDGVVEKFIGDAIVAVFGAPIAHEDDPARAVEAALAMLEVSRRRSEQAAASVQLRIGINSGLVVAGAVGDGKRTGVIGDAVNVAARLQQVAAPGEVLLAASTWRRVRDAYETEPADTYELKGRTTAVEAHRLLSRRAEWARAQAPFVGRRDEQSLLELLWSSARKGNTHVVSVIGEAGVGKSRLLAELRPEGAALDLRVACSGERAYGPVIELVAQILGRLPRELEELERSGAALGLELDAVAGLAPLLGLGAAPPVVRAGDEQRKQQAFAGVWQFLLAVCRDRPTLLVVDDVHWADDSSRELVGFLLERLGGAPMLLVLSHRPGFEVIERAELRASHTAIRLEPLSPADSVELAQGFLGVTELPEGLERVVAQRAGGNPFFVEELLQALIESGSLQVEDGRAVLAGVDLDVPDTVQGTIVARLDRLDRGERELVHEAAVLGRTFPVDLLADLAGADVSELLAALARAQILVELVPGEWSFKHDLIHEVAYETLLLRTRRELHGRVAQLLEARVARDPTQLEAIAEHYARAEAQAEARRYALAAGDYAQQRMGFAEALRRYERALGLWGDGDREGQLELLMKLALAANFAGESARARTAFIAAEAGWRELGEPRRSGEALAGLGRALWSAGDADRGGEALARAIDRLSELGPSRELVQALAWLGALRMLEGRVAEGSELAQKGLPLAEELGLVALRSDLLNTAGVCEVVTGRLQGVERLEASLELAKEAGETEPLGRAYTNLSSTLTDVGRLREALGVAREGRLEMRRLGHVARSTFIAGNEALILVELGRFDEADALLAEVLDTGQALLGLVGLLNLLLPRAEAALRRGDYGRVRTTIDEVLPLARGFGGVEFLSPTLRIEAELEEVAGNVPAARELAREAVELLEEGDVTHAIQLLPLVARLRPRVEAVVLLERVAQARAFPRAAAAMAEGNAQLERDRGQMAAAAELYRELELPYEQARCLIAAGTVDRGRQLADSIGASGGPLVKIVPLAR